MNTTLLPPHARESVDPPSLEQLANATLSSFPPPRELGIGAEAHDRTTAEAELGLDDDDYLLFLTGAASPQEWLGRPVGSLPPVAFDNTTTVTAVPPSSRDGGWSMRTLALTATAALLVAFLVGMVGGRGLAALGLVKSAAPLPTLAAPLVRAPAPSVAAAAQPTAVAASLDAITAPQNPPTPGGTPSTDEPSTLVTKPSAAKSTGAYALKPAVPVASPPASPLPASDDTEAAPPEAEVAAPAEITSAFDPAAAKKALAGAATALRACYDADLAVSAVRVAVTFAPATGHVTTALVEQGSDGVGTPVATCVARELRSLEVPPFSGDLTTIHATAHLD